MKVYVETLLRGEREIFLKLLYVILQASSAPGSYPKDEVYSIQTFSFWYQLQVSFFLMRFGSIPRYLILITSRMKSCRMRS